MPPSRHSSSSHSHSSHSSSSRSSSSRSSYSSSSRSSSSSSSRSFGPRPSSSRSSSSSRGPSAHSTSTHASPSAGRAAPPPSRPRVNQPTGYRPSPSAPRPRNLYGAHHSYVYYPVSWVDSSTGTSFEKGYYDENGTRYDDVAFSKNGVYENVLCHCPYCGQDTVMDLSAKDVGVQQLQCPGCGGPMEIRSMLDDAVQGASSVQKGTQQDEPKKKHGPRILLYALLAFLVLSFLTVKSGLRDLKTQPLQLVSTGYHSYRVADSGESPDLTLSWDKESESYYDPNTECWVWYNTDVTPNVWQYWVEGISSDYGDYGWMEHDEDGWFIEADRGVWIEVPGWYDTSGLWYFD